VVVKTAGTGHDPGCERAMPTSLVRCAGGCLAAGCAGLVACRDRAVASA
jgi:hypothetical protein